MAERTGRNAAVDALKLLLALFVVGIHGSFLDDVNRFAGYLLHNGLFRVAVPTYLVINGFYFERVGSKDFRKWFLRLLGVFWIWTTLYSVFWFPAAHERPFSILKAYTVGYYQLWYLSAAALAGAVLYLARGWRTGLLLAAAVALYGCGLLLQFAPDIPALDGTVLAELGRNDLYYRNFLFFGVPFMALGMLISRHEASLAASARWVMPLSVLGVALVLVESALYWWLTPAPHPELDLMVTLFPACPALFLMARQIHVAGNSKLLSQLATGIYLVHFFFIDKVLHYTTETPAALVTIAVSLVLSFGLIRLNRWLPLL